MQHFDAEVAKKERRMTPVMDVPASGSSRNFVFFVVLVHEVPLTLEWNR